VPGLYGLGGVPRAAFSYVAPSRHVSMDGPISWTDSPAASNTANSTPGS